MMGGGNLANNKLHWVKYTFVTKSRSYDPDISKALRDRESVGYVGYVALGKAQSNLNQATSTLKSSLQPKGCLQLLSVLASAILVFNSVAACCHLPF